KRAALPAPEVRLLTQDTRMNPVSDIAAAAAALATTAADAAACTIAAVATRLEHDLIGDRQVPAAAYYGVHTLRAVENFPITNTSIAIYPDLIAALACIKEAAARANQELGLLDAVRADAIAAACRERRDGRAAPRLRAQGGRVRRRAEDGPHAAAGRRADDARPGVLDLRHHARRGRGTASRGGEPDPRDQPRRHRHRHRHHRPSRLRV